MRNNIKRDYIKLKYMLSTRKFSRSMLSVFGVILKAVGTGLFSKGNAPGLIYRFYHSIKLKSVRNPKYFIEDFSNTVRICTTYTCNASCRACYAREIKKDKKHEMNLDSFEKVLSWVDRQRIENVRFLGGEPTVHPDFGNMIRLCMEKELRVSISTNGLFEKEIIDFMDNPVIQDISVNYNAHLAGGEEARELFFENVRMLKQRGIPFGFSYIMNHKDTIESDMQILDDAAKYSPQYIRVCIELPEVSKEDGLAHIVSSGSYMYERLNNMHEKLMRIFVLFFVYRPLPRCMFTGQQWSELEKKFNYGVFSRCPLTFKTGGRYVTLTTVNPDMTVIPCASVFIEGPNLLDFGSKDEVSAYFTGKIDEILSLNSMDECSVCSFGNGFKNKTVHSAKDEKVFNDNDICQGGCVNYRLGRYDNTPCYID